MQPDGLFVIPPRRGGVVSFAAIGESRGGSGNWARIEKLGIKTVREMQEVDVAMFEREFGPIWCAYISCLAALRA
jgi:hypothetical protein